MKKRARIVSGLAALAALLLAPLAEASLTRATSPALEAPALTLTLAAPEPSDFSLFEGTELARALASRPAFDLISITTDESSTAVRTRFVSPSELLADELPEGPELVPITSVREQRFNLQLPPDIFGLEPLRDPPGDEATYAKTRYRVFGLLGTPILGELRGVSLELHWGSGEFRAGLASGTVGWLSQDPMGDTDSPNLYGFVGGRPHEMTDPLGLQAAPVMEPAPFVEPFVAPGARPYVPGLAGGAKDYVPRLGAPGMPPESAWSFRADLEAAKRARPAGAGSPVLGGRTVEELTEREQQEFLEHRRQMRTDPEYRRRAEGVARLISDLRSGGLPRPAAGGAGGGDEPPGIWDARAGRYRDPKTGQFVSDPRNPPSPYTMTDAQRRAEWKRIAEDPTSPLTPAQRAEVQARGWRGPQQRNPRTGEWETMELSHEPVPLREGGTSVAPRWPDDHAAVDPFRYVKKD